MCVPALSFPSLFICSVFGKAGEAYLIDFLVMFSILF